MNKKMPSICPSCGGPLAVRRLECTECDTAVEGLFELPVLARLTHEDQEFLLKLVKCSGSLKELAKIYGVSYPTVRNRLDALIDRIKALEKESGPGEEAQSDDGQA